MPLITADDILNALRPLNEPGQITDIQIEGGNVRLIIEIDPKLGTQIETIRQNIEKIVKSLPGVTDAAIILTAEQPKPAPKPVQTKTILGVNAIIAVASGKGGVGKSTTAVNLALALSQMGQRVGLLDADIYGPSIPRLLAVSGQPRLNDAKQMIPHMSYDMPVMSIGFLIAEDAPTIWRGAMVQGALQQLLKQVEWGELDVLVIDMPPGTGDAHLTLAQQVELAGAVIVSTPQDIALIDARKALAMFQRVNVPVLGIIENMSYYSCVNCGHRADIFGHGGAAQEAEKLQVPFLGEIPLDIRIRETSDAGTPIVIAEPESPHSHTYEVIARHVLEQIQKTSARSAPRISIE